MSEQRVTMIRERLEREFSPQALAIVDESHQHAGHASAGGAGHFRVTIRADAFEGKTTLQRHRMVYAAVGDMMPEEIHALSIDADAP
ncbi:BolA family transcriptional regulator [Ectothiorhodospiraceae bacterium BW-2]|nr:BolA family transcriptional regulator [Ectothiorhodospiraceae bacterium BW-2]